MRCDLSKSEGARIRVAELLDYDPLTGIFVWKVGQSNRAQKGSRAGTNRGGGYRRIAIDGKLIYEHQLAWLLMKGEWPSELIDHIDGNPSNNRISNLRLASRAENAQNLGLRATNTSGRTGVSLHRKSGKWCAYIVKDGRKYHLGLHATVSAAAAAYETAKAKMHTFNPRVRDA